MQGLWHSYLPFDNVQLLMTLTAHSFTLPVFMMKIHLSQEDKDKIWVVKSANLIYPTPRLILFLPFLPSTFGFAKVVSVQEFFVVSWYGINGALYLFIVSFS